MTRFRREPGMRCKQCNGEGRLPMGEMDEVACPSCSPQFRPGDRVRIRGMHPGGDAGIVIRVLATGLCEVDVLSSPPRAGDAYPVYAPCDLEAL